MQKEMVQFFRPDKKTIILIGSIIVIVIVEYC